MRHLSLSIFFVFFAIFSSAQNNLVTVIATGDGISEAQATNRALRNAIEKTFGVFISSSTQIKNDELISDEIASVASGNIASYDVLSSTQNGSSFVVSVKALISPEKVVLNLKNAGQKVELNGSVFAQNILVEKFYKDQEVQVIKDFIETYKNFKIIDSFSIYLCEPFFMNFPNLEYASRHRDIIAKFVYGTEPEVKSGICFDYYAGFYNSGTRYSNFYYSYLTKDKQVKFHNELFTRNSSLNEQQEEKLLNDLSGPNYLLPVIYRPIYNVSKAVTLTNAFSKLLSVISIKDIENYNKKLGESFSLEFIGLDKEVEFKGDMIKITNNNSKTTFLVGEWAKKRFKAVFNLRNSESIDLLKEFFNTRFYHTSPVNLYVNNESGFSKNIHLVLTHENLKEFANYKAYTSTSVIDITPTFSNNGYLNNNYWLNDINFSIYPSIILFRFTLEDLQKFKSINFSFEPIK